MRLLVLTVLAVGALSAAMVPASALHTCGDAKVSTMFGGIWAGPACAGVLLVIPLTCTGGGNHTHEYTIQWLNGTGCPTGAVFLLP